MLIEDGLTLAQRIEKRVVVRLQAEQAWPARDVTIQCGCGRRPSILKMYRCRFCGEWFCGGCALDHFGPYESSGCACAWSLP